MVRAGQRVRFDPFDSITALGIDDMRCEVEGTVVNVYTEHQWFSVVWGNPKQRISFKFCDIGEKVYVC